MIKKSKISAKEGNNSFSNQYGYQGDKRSSFGYDPGLNSNYYDEEVDVLEVPADARESLSFTDEVKQIAQPPTPTRERENLNTNEPARKPNTPAITGLNENHNPETEEKEKENEEETGKNKETEKVLAKTTEGTELPIASTETPTGLNSATTNNDDVKAKPKASQEDILAVNDKESAKENEAAEDLKSEDAKKGKEEADPSAGRITDMTDASMDGGVERNKILDEAHQQKEQQHLENVSKKAAGKGGKGIGKLKDNETKKDPADSKLKKTEDAVVEQKSEKVAEVNAQQVDIVDEVKTPEAKEQEAKDALKKSLEANMPKTLEDVDKFKERGMARKIGSQVQKTIEGKTKEISGTFEQLNDTAPPADTKKPVPLEEIEKAPITDELKLGQNLVPPVKEETLNLESYVKESANLLQREGIEQEHLDMVDSGDLFEAKQLKDDIEKKSVLEPKNLRQEEKKLHKETENELSKNEKAEKEKMQKERATGLGGARKDQDVTKSSFEKKREEVTKHINTIYETTNKQVQDKLANLKVKALADFNKEEATASSIFESNVKTRMDKYKDERYDGWLVGTGRWLKDKLFGMDELPEVKKIFETERAAYITRIDAAIARIIKESQTVIDECKNLIAQARKDIDKYVKSLPDDLKKIGQDAQKEIQKKLDELDEKVNKAAEELKKELEKKRAEAIKKIDEKIAKMKEEMSGALAKIGNLLLDAALKFFKWALSSVGFSADEIMGVINKGKAVITAIVTKPIVFMKNLAAAVGGGIKNFGANIMNHLKNGFMSWLTGQMNALPIQLPEKFDIKGIFSVALQVLGLTWGNFRNRLSNKVGEDKVAMAEKGGEKGLEIVTKVKEEGPVAMYDMMADQAEAVKEQVVEGAKEWAITTIIKQGIIKLASFLNPAGAIVQAILAIYNGVMFFINNWQRILDFVNSVFESIAKIAAGAIGAAASFIEKSLAMTIPIILDFMARMLGLSGIADKIHKVIQKVRKPIDKAIDKVINFLSEKLKKLWGKVSGKDKKKKGSKDDNDDQIDDKNKHSNHQIVKEIKSKIQKVDNDKYESISELQKDKQAESTNLENLYSAKVKDKSTVINIDVNSPNKDDNSFDATISVGSSKDKARITLDQEDVKFGDIVVPFNMSGESHHIIVREDGTAPEMFMASVEEKLKVKWATLKQSFKKYIDAIPIEDVTLELWELEEEFEKAIQRLFNLKDDINTYYQELVASGRTHKPLNPKTKSEFNDKRLNDIKTKIKEATIALQALGKKYGVPDMTPLALEQMKIDEHVEPLRQKLMDVVNEFKAELESALPPGAEALYRGSLANGIRSFKGAKVSDAAELVKPDNFDCDAFISVTEEEWKVIEQGNSKVIKDGKINLERINNWTYKNNLLKVGKKIQEKLNTMDWYKKSKDGNADFYFYIQPKSKTMAQEKYGNIYPEGALENAGFPTLEDELETVPNATIKLNDGSETTVNKGKRLPVKPGKLA